MGFGLTNNFFQKAERDKLYPTAAGFTKSTIQLHFVFQDKNNNNKKKYLVFSTVPQLKMQLKLWPLLLRYQCGFINV